MVYFNMKISLFAMYEIVDSAFLTTEFFSMSFDINLFHYIYIIVYAPKSINKKSVIINHFLSM